MAGPFCAMMLADLGADVIKIEPPAGDSTRQMPGGVDGDTPSFNAVNRGKRSVRLNLKTPEGRAVFERLSRSADILVENYRPGVMNALGLGYEHLSAANPRLIYASISGYGQTGPDRHKGGFDLIAQGVSGIMSITGEPGGAAGEGRRAAHRSRRRAVRARRHSRGARESPSDGSRPARRHVARRRRRGAVGVGGDGIFFRDAACPKRWDPRTG